MKPATPLPWESREIGINDFLQDGFRSISEINRVGDMPSKVAEFVFSTDAAYIVHACNAYPRLVDFVRSRQGRADADALLAELGE